MLSRVVLASKLGAPYCFGVLVLGKLRHQGTKAQRITKGSSLRFNLALFYIEFAFKAINVIVSPGTVKTQMTYRVEGEYI